jgi:3-dehydroquinate dehydratase
MQEDADGTMRPAPVPKDYLITVRSVDDGGAIQLRASDLAESLKQALTGVEPVKVARLNDIEKRLAQMERDLSYDRHSNEDVLGISGDVAELNGAITEIRERLSALEDGEDDEGVYDDTPVEDQQREVDRLQRENDKLRRMLDVAIEE